jgi:iron complex transport system substrate-binding protein
MAAHQKSIAAIASAWAVGLVLAVCLVLAVVPVGLDFSRATPAQTHPQRIISIIPSTTEMLFAIGAGPRVIGVGNFDRFPPEALTRTRVGGLIDPDVERIISLKPDLVVVYGTQSDLRTQMDRANIPVFLYQHAGLADITATIRQLGARVGHVRESTDLAKRIESDLADVRKRVAGRPRPRTLLVFVRDAETLRGIYASGGVGFLHDMLDAAGGVNVFADVKRQSLHTTSELAITRAPEVILEIGAETASSKSRNIRAWEALGSVPAVRNRRIYLLTGDGMMNPGPRVADAVRRMANVLHPNAFK